MLAGVEGHADPGHTERQEEDASLHGTKPGLRSTRWERLRAVACEGGRLACTGARHLGLVMTFPATHWVTGHLSQVSQPRQGTSVGMWRWVWGPDQPSTPQTGSCAVPPARHCGHSLQDHSGPQQKTVTPGSGHRRNGDSAGETESYSGNPASQPSKRRFKRGSNPSITRRCFSPGSTTSASSGQVAAAASVSPSARWGQD
jgi:hypothetical protein